MRVVCTNGLFVGVEEYIDLDDIQQLPKAAGDAGKLFTYFSMAHDGGTWSLLIDNELNTTRPSRINILRDVASFARRVGADECGVFYFAGHGLMLDGEMLLAPSDFRRQQPLDSSVSLTRIFEILREESVPRAQFLFVLDCCREGDVVGPGNNIPPNVVIIYAGPAGQPAVEDQDGGILAQALLKVLRRFGERSAGTKKAIRAPTRTVQQIFRELTKQVQTEASGNASKPELCGAAGEHMHIPLVPVKVGKSTRVPPMCFLETYEIKSSARRLQESIQDSLASFFGLAREQAPKLTSLVSEKKCIQVSLPRNSDSADSRAFLEGLLSQYDVFTRLTLRWNKEIKHALFRQFAEQENLGSSTIEENQQYMYDWEDLGREGRMFVDYNPDVDSGRILTTVSIECQARESGFLSLEYLLPRLGDLYDRLWTLA